MEVDYRVLVGGIAETLRGPAAAHAGLSQKVLTQQLRELANDDVVQRQPQGGIPAPVEYSLTEYGRTLLPLVESIRSWGNAHIERMTEIEPVSAGSSQVSAVPTPSSTRS